MTPLDHGRELPTVHATYAHAESFAWHDDTGETRADWRVLPVTLTRDSQPIDQSNWAAAQRILDDAGATYEIHRFRHWVIGWYEAIFIAPDDVSLTAAGEIVCALDNYPVLDDEDLSAREYEDQIRAWTDYAAHDYVRDLPLDHDASRDLVREYLESAVNPHDVPGMRFVEQHSGGPYFSYRVPDRDETADLLRDARAWRKAGG